MAGLGIDENGDSDLDICEASGTLTVSGVAEVVVRVMSDTGSL